MTLIELALITLVGLGVLGGLAFLHHQWKVKKEAQQREARRARRARRQQAMPPRPINTPPNLDPRASLREGRRPTVLVVDDSPTVVKMLKETLEEHEYRVVTAENGRKAWGVLQEENQTVDLVLSDIDMPMMNGFALLKLIRSDIVHSDVPVILMTGDVFYAVEAGKEEGVSALLSKPFDNDNLLGQIKFLLQH